MKMKYENQKMYIKVFLIHKQGMIDISINT